MIEMKQLQYFRACVETGNFSKAAELLYTTQPNVSRTIKSLENQLGVSLFARTARGIRPTPEGERVYRYAQQDTGRIICRILQYAGDHTTRYKFQKGSAE